MHRSKKIFLSLCFVIVSSQSLIATVQNPQQQTKNVVATQSKQIIFSVRDPQEQNIKAKLAALESELWQGKLMRYGVTSAVTLGLAYGLYKYFQSWNEQPVPNKDVMSLPPTPEGHEELKKVIATQIAPSFLSFDWFKKTGVTLRDFLFVGTGMQVANSVKNRVEARAFHPHTLEWFVQNKTTLTDLMQFHFELNNARQEDLQAMVGVLAANDHLKKSTLQELEEYIQRLAEHMQELAYEAQNPTAKKDVATPDTRLMYGFLITAAANRLVNDVEAIIAFMEYQCRTICVKNAMLSMKAGNIIRFVLNKTKSFCKEINTILSGTGTVRSLNAVREFRQEVRSMLKEFAHIEAQS